VLSVGSIRGILPVLLFVTQLVQVAPVSCNIRSTFRTYDSAGKGVFPPQPERLVGREKAKIDENFGRAPVLLRTPVVVSRAALRLVLVMSTPRNRVLRTDQRNRAAACAPYRW
jgi:hypothetical protein